MSAAETALAEVRELLTLEADLLDRRRWAEWLELYLDDCVYWVPSWLDEETTGEDPELQVNMIYITSKAGLEARLLRIESGEAYAESPAARTSHLVDSIRIVDDTDDGIEVSAKWLALSCNMRWGKQLRGGWYDYRLKRRDGRLAIAEKKITLLEDVIDGAIDIHQI